MALDAVLQWRVRSDARDFESFPFRHRFGEAIQARQSRARGRLEDLSRLLGSARAPLRGRPKPGQARCARNERQRRNRVRLVSRAQGAQGGDGKKRAFDNAAYVSTP